MTGLPCAAPKSFRGFQTEIYTKDEFGRALSGKCLRKHTFTRGWVTDLFRVLYFDDQNIVIYQFFEDEDAYKYYTFVEYNHDRGCYVRTDRRPEQMQVALDKQKPSE